MLDILMGKKVIFFDVGYTLDMPASGDWMFTNMFLELAGEKLKLRTEAEIQQARDAGLRFLARDHLIQTVDAEIRNFFDYYSVVSNQLNLGLTEEERNRIARDRACNMRNYIPYPGITDVLSTLSKTHKLGIISDTWPSIEPQLKYIGVSPYLSFRTFSCFVGVFKPDKRIYLDALNKCGVPAGETVFIDDAVCNLDGAAALGITPILIAANPASDAEARYMKIHDLRELIR